MGWGLDGRARLRKVTVKVAVKLSCEVSLQKKCISLGTQFGWGLEAWMAARGGARLQLQSK